MSVHGFIPGLVPWVLPAATSAVCVIGLVGLVSGWGLGRLGRFLGVWAREAFRDGGAAFLRTLVLDVLLFRRVWQRSPRRWAMHMAMFWVFVVFGGFVFLSLAALALASLDPAGAGGTFARYVKELTLPYSLAGYVLVAASGIALGRRLVVPDVRRRTRLSDFLLVGTVFAIATAGMVAEWFSGYDLLVGPAIKNWSLALQILSIHAYAVFLLFVMMIPWTRFRHIVASPLLLLARRGGE
ncbi:MAG: hypothetical protein ABFC89_09160 [Methanospirillum sp.]